MTYDVLDPDVFKYDGFELEDVCIEEFASIGVSTPYRVAMTYD